MSQESSIETNASFHGIKRTRSHSSLDSTVGIDIFRPVRTIHLSEQMQKNSKIAENDQKLSRRFLRARKSINLPANTKSHPSVNVSVGSDNSLHNVLYRGIKRRRSYFSISSSAASVSESQYSNLPQRTIKHRKKILHRDTLLTYISSRIGDAKNQNKDNTLNDSEENDLNECKLFLISLIISRFMVIVLPRYIELFNTFFTKTYMSMCSLKPN